MSAAQQPRIVGRYELHGELAAGGMATVHLGRSIGAAGFAKSVAIKRLHEHFARDPEFVAALLEEARLSERIRHPNVVATLDVVAVEHELLLVMEYVHGETLARLLRACARDGERCPPAVAASIAQAVLLGLHAAHNATDAAGAPLCIVHRDVSPQNVIVGADGIARLLDFGIAKAAGAASHTREGEVKGKLPYMAPEILKHQPASPQSDVYAVAVTLWESLCARRLFRGESEVATWAAVLEGAVEPPSRVVGPIGPLDDVVMRGLARSTSERYATALAMAKAIEGAIRLAPASEVSAWVAERAADALAERSQTVRDIERTPARAISPEARTAVAAEPPAPASSLAPAAGAVAAAPTASFAAASPPRRRGWAWGVGAVAMTAVVGLLVARSMDARRAHAVTPAVAPAESLVGVPTAAADPVAAPDTAPVPAPPPTGLADAAAPAEGARTAEPPGARPRRPSATAPGAAGTAAPPRNAPDPCDPPFTIDEGGRKHFKLNCVN
jgi:eukaryotic-like serine/threonine-protein kinase